MILNVLKVFGLSAFSFFVALFLTPIFTHYFYKYKMWKRESRSGENNTISEDFKKIHNFDSEIKTPRIGGMLIWVSVFVVTMVMWLISILFPSDLTLKLNFLSKNQTWLILFTLITASLVGLADDILQILGKNKSLSMGLSLKKRIFLILIIGAIAAWWFFFKLGMSGIHVPFLGEIELGYLFIPFFMLVMVGIFSGGVIDGIDGLAGGIMASIFSAYAGIAFFQNQIDVAAFCAVMVGGILAFLWFNIPPARFYMGETGMLGLTTTITVIAFLTHAVIVLPIIASPLIAATISALMQVFSKKYFKKKIFLVAPIHHHFQAKGWPSYKVTMRFWIISIIMAIIGMVIALI